MEQDQDIGPILLKLRYLASRLGDNVLEDWVRHESEGYPSEAELPDYRIVGVTYKVDTSGPFGSGMRNAPVPSALVEQFGGESWTDYKVRQSVTSIGSLLTGENESGTLTMDASNLILVLQGKIYPDNNIIAVTGSISKAAMVEIQSAVRSRILELTIKLEKEVPLAAEINLGPTGNPISAPMMEKVSQLSQTIIHGDYTEISSHGDGNVLKIAIEKGNAGQLEKGLIEGGIEEADAKELVEIMASEEPEGPEKPLGVKARAWVADKIAKGADGIWKVGLSVATKVVTEAAMKYYGLK